MVRPHDILNSARSCAAGLVSLFLVLLACGPANASVRPVTHCAGHPAPRTFAAASELSTHLCFRRPKPGGRIAARFPAAGATVLARPNGRLYVITPQRTLRVRGMHLERRRWTSVRVTLSVRPRRLVLSSRGRRLLTTSLAGRRDHSSATGTLIPAEPGSGGPDPATPTEQADPASPAGPVAPGSPTPDSGTQSGAEPRLFAPDSIWNARLAGDAQLDPTSTIRMSAFNAQITGERAAGIGPWINDQEYSSPIYVVGPDAARVPVKLDGVNPSLQAALSAGVPIPAGARPAAGTDMHMAIYQPSTDTLWEFWQARSLADGWHASWAGAMRDVSASPGYYTSGAWPGLTPTQGWNWGATAASLPIMAGLITLDDLRRGRIDHALALAVPNPCGRLFSWPAQRTDGSSTSADCIPEGAHLRLDPHLDLSALDLPPMTRMLAEAAQRYGIVIRDRTNHETTFFAEDPTPSGARLHGAGGLYGGIEPWTFVPRFPWSRLELLRMTECFAAPCLAPPLD
jgi:hypothetical protein